jgi:hypothetical protein
LKKKKIFRNRRHAIESCHDYGTLSLNFVCSK